MSCFCVIFTYFTKYPIHLTLGIVLLDRVDLNWGNTQEKEFVNETYDRGKLYF